MFSNQTRGGGEGGLILNMKKFRSTKEREIKEDILGIMIKPFGVDNTILTSILQTNIWFKQCLKWGKVTKAEMWHNMILKEVNLTISEMWQELKCNKV